MRLPPFLLHQPDTVQQALSIMAEHPEARLLAGGTDLLVNMKHRVESPPVLVGLDRITGLDEIRHGADGTTIGALTTLKRIQSEERLAADYPALVEAARRVGSYRHQTMGTLGGNLCQNTRCRYFNQPWQWRQARSLCHKAGGDRCHVMNKDGVCYASYSGDLAPALLALDAAAQLHGSDGERVVPLSELYTGEGRTPMALGRAEMLVAVLVPPTSANGRSTYQKHSLRGSIDFPVVGCAVWRGDAEVRVAFTAVDRRPVRAQALEEALAGGAPDRGALRDAAPLARKAATPTRTTTHPPSHKRELMEALFVRAAETLL